MRLWVGPVPPITAAVTAQFSNRRLRTWQASVASRAQNSRVAEGTTPMPGDSPIAGRHVLMVRPCALGDAVLTLPVLAARLEAGGESVIVLSRPESWRFLRSDLPGIRIDDFGAGDWLGLFGAKAGFGRSANAVLSRVDSAIGPAACQQKPTS